MTEETFGQICISEEAYDWLQGFKRLHYMKTNKEAVDKLIEIHKSWNDKVLNGSWKYIPDKPAKAVGESALARPLHAQKPKDGHGSRKREDVELCKNWRKFQPNEAAKKGITFAAITDGETTPDEAIAKRKKKWEGDGALRGATRLLEKQMMEREAKASIGLDKHGAQTFTADDQGRPLNDHFTRVANTDISLCPHCHCMTKTIRKTSFGSADNMAMGRPVCGKCGENKT